MANRRMQGSAATSGSPAARAAAGEEVTPGESTAFRPGGPWVVNRYTVGWLDGVDVLRSDARTRAEQLASGRGLPSGLRGLELFRRVTTAVAGLALETPMIAVNARVNGRSFRREFRGRMVVRSRTLFEALGPTYIKLGQLISSSPGLFPPEVVTEFAKCRDRVDPVPFADVRRTVESELGGSLEDLFESFDPDAIAAASIAQVHRARLNDGTRVVVKVQRPGLDRVVSQDLATMAAAASLLEQRIDAVRLTNLKGVVELFAETVVEELDFRIEAANLLDLAEVHGELGISSIYFPRPHPTMVTEHVLVLEELNGIAFDDPTAMAAAGVDTHELLKQGIVAFLEGAMIGGIFHGDLHAGNLFVDEDGRYVVVDFGITGRLSPESRRAFVRLVFSAARGDVHGQFEALRDLGAMPADVDIDELISELGADREPSDPLDLEPEELAGVMEHLTEVMVANRMRLPKDLMLLLKNLIYLDGAISSLAPDLDLIELSEQVLVLFAARYADEVAAAAPTPEAAALIRGGLEALGGEGVPVDADEVTWPRARERRAEMRRRIRDGRRRRR